MTGDPLSAIKNGAAGLRVMIVAAHPDDEVIGAGSRLPVFRDLLLVHVTDGAPASMYDAHRHGFANRADYARARRDELADALAAAGANPEMLALGIPDQEASLNLEELTNALTNLIAQRRPDLVLTHPCEGGHPDHDACAFAVHAACSRALGTRPALCEFASYHSRSGAFHAGDFLPGTDAGVLTIPLDAVQQELKQRMISCFRTQRETLAPFHCETERYRSAPRYDFTQPPHGGTLYYEQFPWGMTGAQFRELARTAIVNLKLEEACA